MYLYRIEAVTEELGLLTIVIAASNEESAFAAAGEHIERYTLPAPVIKELTLLEKKRLTSGTGYIVPTLEL